MAAMYNLVYRAGIGYLNATNEINRQFIADDYGEKYRLPYYWAPFVLYWGEINLCGYALQLR